MSLSTICGAQPQGASTIQVAFGSSLGPRLTETQLPEGARVAILMDDDQPPFDLEPEDEVAIEAAVRALDAGGGKPISDLESMLSRYR